MKTFSLIFLLVGVAIAYPTLDKDPKVVGGREALEHEAPYIVSFQVDRLGNGDFRHVCGGSILTATWVLSAAHCYTEVGPQFDFQVVAGQHNLAIESGNEQARRIVEIIVHANFIAGPIVGPFDIMVLRLETPLTLVPGIVESINLPPQGRISTGTTRLFGWGSTSDTTTPHFPDILHTVTKPIIAWELCREIVNAVFDHEPLHASNLCTGPLDTNHASCNG